MKKAFLALADGTVFEGISQGVDGTVIGEIVFTTGMTGYVEAMTDPGFSGQIVAMTYPLIGNYGVNREDCQSDHVQVKGLIVKELADFPNNFRCEETLKAYLEEEKVVAISGIDTRALTKLIRTQGAMNGMITTDENFVFGDRLDDIKAYEVGAPVASVTCREQKSFGAGSLRVAMLDFGLRRDLIDSFVSRGAQVTVYPADTQAETILKANPDGIVLSNGPGDPALYPAYALEIKKLAGSGKPIFATGLGHQLLALAMGGKTEKLKFGHRGANQPVKDLRIDKTFVTVQNHGYAVAHDSLDSAVAEITHINVNDDTVEGIKYLACPALSLQFHPESKPGSKNMKYTLEEFFEMMGGQENA